MAVPGPHVYERVCDPVGVCGRIANWCQMGNGNVLRAPACYHDGDRKGESMDVHYWKALRRSSLWIVGVPLWCLTWFGVGAVLYFILTLK
jgi:hypothetical protein